MGGMGGGELKILGFEKKRNLGKANITGKNFNDWKAKKMDS